MHSVAVLILSPNLLISLVHLTQPGMPAMPCPDHYVSLGYDLPCSLPLLRAAVCCLSGTAVL